MPFWVLFVPAALPVVVVVIAGAISQLPFGRPETRADVEKAVRNRVGDGEGIRKAA